ncbi:hypothetical protein KKA93_03160 [Patescibacteria group bacterium]|nr:hypothetical protein [Patescibacteria group bacterium]MBU1663658.1 hypothetical protein [Patescibacteria group bacterium]MBU1933892.1 hypothetical protein [Patescibacteria group bacterium]MBU2007849.1 hypothetical protein [Patescibacteria group bacterium]MBU2233326.1 hypothetical protein [Patescibacteria group bacterium]
MSLAKKIKSVKGASLLELLVSIGLFSILILSAMQIFKMAVDGQRGSISTQNVQENMRYAMEKMSKEIRMARISNHDCETMFNPPQSAVFKVFNTADANSILYFKNQYGYCVVYYLDNNRLKIMAETATVPVTAFITPAKVEVSNLKFYTDDDLIGGLASTQPYVTMVMDVKAVGLAIHEQKMKIQTTVSSRYYE